MPDTIGNLIGENPYVTVDDDVLGVEECSGNKSLDYEECNLRRLIIADGELGFLSYFIAHLVGFMENLQQIPPEVSYFSTVSVYSVFIISVLLLAERN